MLNEGGGYSCHSLDTNLALIYWAVFFLKTQGLCCCLFRRQQLGCLISFKKIASLKGKPSFKYAEIMGYNSLIFGVDLWWLHGGKSKGTCYFVTQQAFPCSMWVLSFTHDMNKDSLVSQVFQFPNPLARPLMDPNWCGSFPFGSHNRREIWF